ncbi:glutathione S-transferase-like protein [Auriculariales sp. MPI-PUGE-AT-0066]|nr:glutathione S-transferase-like protein [Auriculariales sp. MPI-PUGE-AT-0066]
MSDAPKPAVTLHYLNKSRSLRILWLLEEMGIPYELKKYQRTPEMLAPPELKQAHPMGKAPVLQDGSVTLIESSAIVEYLIHKYGPQFKPSDDNYAETIMFAHLAEASLGCTVSNKIIWKVIPSRVPFFIRPFISIVSNKIIAMRLDPELTTLLQMVEDQLVKNDGKEFLVGDHLTAADVMIVFTFDVTPEFLPELGPKTKAYIERMKARPAFKAAYEKGEGQ